MIFHSNYLSQHMKTKVAMIGGSGFIGTTLTELLSEQGACITIFDLVKPAKQNDNVSYVYYDVRENKPFPDTISAYGYFYFLAACLGKGCAEHPHNGWQTNVWGLTHLLSEVALYDSKPFVIFTSSVAVYDEPQCNGPIKEHAPIKGTDLYGISKVAGESVVRASCVAHGMKSAIVRLFTVYGHGPASAAKGHFLPTWIEQVVQRNRITIFGDGSQMIDLTDVRDVARALVSVARLELRKGDCRIMNVATGIGTTVNEVAHWFKQVKPDLEIVYDRSKSINKQVLMADISTAQETLGYRPKISAKDGIIELLKAAL